MEQVGRIAVFYGLVVPDVAYLAVSAGVGAVYFRKLPPIEIAMTVVVGACAVVGIVLALHEKRRAAARGFRGVLRNSASANSCATDQLLAGIAHD